MEYTIKEAAEIMHLPATTIRYYDKEGLLPYIRRLDSGYRIFSDQDLEMLRIIECLKKTGMPIKEKLSGGRCVDALISEALSPASKSLFISSLTSLVTSFLLNNSSMAIAWSLFI